MLKHFSGTLTLSIFLINLFAQIPHTSYVEDPNGAIRPRNFDMTHLLLSISFEPEKGLVKGNVTHTFTVLQKEIDTVFLDGPKIDFKSIALNGRACNFKTNDEGVVVFFKKSLSWNTAHQLEIEYEAKPKKGLYFIGWNHEPGKSGDQQCAIRKQIWTQGQGIDNRHWLPSFDNMNDKLITELKISFDDGYRVLSNGVLIKKKSNKDGTNLWHYKISHPHPTYLVMVGIGKYEVETTQSKGGVNIHSWFYPEFPKRLGPTYAYTENMMDWMEEEFGVNYPWTDYAQIPVQDFMYGAMENSARKESSEGETRTPDLGIMSAAL